MSTTTVYAEIVKAERDEAGNLVVFGKATGPDLDLDQQICDPAWLEKAMPRWFSTGGNIREQHTAIAAGVATDLAQDGDSWNVTATVVDPTSAKKVEAGVLKGFSVGIKAPRVITDKAAPGGRIVDGQIVEVSLVDRPCNPTALLTLSKAAKPGMQVKGGDFDPDHMVVKVEEWTEHTDEPEAEKDADADLEKRDFSQSERDAAADSGAAMPDGSFPIKSVQDLKNAIRAVGRAKNPAKAKAHIKARAKALGKPQLIPDEWKTVDPDLEKADDGDEQETHDPAEIAAVRDGLVALIKAELDELCDGEDELCDVQELLCSLKMLMCWWEGEADEGEVPDPFPNGGDDASQLITIPLAVEPEITKTPEPEATKATGPDLTELVKAAVTEATKAHEEELAALRADLAKVLATPVPGGPAITRHPEAEAAAAELAKTAQATRYRQLAAQVTDREMAAYYRNKAAELTARPASEGA